MSQATTLKDSLSATSSQETEAGSKPCDVRECQQTFLFGLEAAPVSRSRSAAKTRALPTTAISGRTSTLSLRNASLNSCLASRLQMLCATIGSTVYTQTWKLRVTPAGRSYWEHTAQGLTTSADDFSGWGTPRATNNAGIPCPDKTGRGSRLEDQAALATWPTCTATDSVKGGTIKFRKNAIDLPTAAQLTVYHWVTPTSRDHKDTAGMSLTRRDSMGMSVRTRLDQLSRQVLLAATGTTPSQSSVETTRSGVLNPAFSRWLMSFDEIWDVAAILAYRCRMTRLRQQRSMRRAKLV